MKKSKLLALVLSLCVIGAMMIVGVSAADVEVGFEFQGSCIHVTNAGKQNRWTIEVNVSNSSGVTAEPGDIKVEFYSDTTKIATVENDISIALGNALSVNLQIGVDNSSSWKQDTLVFDTAKAPTRAKIYYKGELKDTENLNCDPAVWASKAANVPQVSITPRGIPNVYYNTKGVGFDLLFPNATADYAVGSVTLDLYKDDTFLAQVTNEKPINITGNSGNKMIYYTAVLVFGDATSSSWDQSAVAIANKDLIPNRVVVKVNGVQFNETRFTLDETVWNSKPELSVYKVVKVRDAENAREYRKTVVANADNTFNYTRAGYVIEGLYSDATLINKVIDGNTFTGDNAAVEALPNVLYIKWVPTAATQKQMKLVAVRGIVLTMIMPEYDIEIADAEGVTVTYTGKMTPGEDKFAFCDSWSAEWAVEEGYTLNKVLVNGEEYDAANYNVKWNDTDVTIEFDVTAPVVEEEVVEEEVVEEEVVEEEVVTEEVAA